jgi:hypothetical protein
MTMPSKAQYAALIDELRAIKHELRGGEDDKAKLALSRRTLQAMMTYLRFDPEVLDDDLTRPIALLLNAAYDASKGASPSLLDHKPAEGKKPTGLAREEIQGVMAFALALMCAAKMGTHLGAQWCADEARKSKVLCEDGSFITAKQIITWRKEITGGRAPEAARKTFDGWRNDRSTIASTGTILAGLRTSRDHQTAKATVQLLIKHLAGAAPESAPKRKAA